MDVLRQGLLFGFEAGLVAGLILFLFHMRHRVGLSPLYIAVGTFQYLIVVLAQSIAVEVRPGLFISPGSAVLFVATLFAVLLVYIHEDAEETRLLVYGLAIANMSLVLLSNLFGQHLDSPLTQNHLRLPRELFFQDVGAMMLGTALLVVDGMLLILLFEALGRVLARRPFLRTFSTLGAVVAFDSLVFVTGLAFRQDHYGSMLTSNLVGKLLGAIVFSGILTFYVRSSRSLYSPTETGPMRPNDAFRMLTFRQKYKQLKASQEAVTAITERLDLALSAARVGIWDWYPQDDRLVWDDHMFRLFGVRKETFRGSTKEFFRAVHPEDRERLKGELEDSGKYQEVDTTYRVLQPDGTLRYICDRARPYRDERGQVERMIGICWDITEQTLAENELAGLTEKLSRANVQLEEQATHDPLTGLFNRRGLETIVRRELGRARRSGASSVAILADCDDFKGINDTYGHHVGDAVLVSIGHALERALRRGDVVGRIGGDEFLVFLPETSVAEAGRVADKLRNAVVATSPPGLEAGVATISLGAAAVPKDETALSQIVALTQSALKQSKAAGKDRVFVDRSSEKIERIGQHASVAEPLIQAGELQSIAHPIFRLVNQTVDAHEFVLRGPPGEWELPETLLSRSNCGPNLHQFDVATALVHLEAARRDVNIADRIHLNILPSTLLSDEFDPLHKRLTDEPRGRFCLELSGQSFAGDPSRYLSAITRLRTEGILFALDGVALDTPALELLLVLEPEFIKFGRSAFDDLLGSPSVRRKLGRLLRVVRCLNSCAVAVGIESEAERMALLDLGLTLGQGTLWADRSLRTGTRALEKERERQGSSKVCTPAPGLEAGFAQTPPPKMPRDFKVAQS